MSICRNEAVLSTRLQPQTRLFERASTEQPRMRGVRETHLVSEDAELRQLTNDVLAKMGVRCVTFCDPDAYLSYVDKRKASCLIIDMQFATMTGLDLRRQAQEGPLPPTILVSRHPDPRSIVSAMKAGVIEVLVHPVEPETLSLTVCEAISLYEKTRLKNSEMQQLRDKYLTLSRRERQVLVLVVTGLLNKQSAATLGISEVTLQIHRGKIMKKMAAKSFAELVRMAVKLRIPQAA